MTPYLVLLYAGKQSNLKRKKQSYMLNHYLVLIVERCCVVNTTQMKHPQLQVHLIIRGNTSNMVKAMADGDFEDLGCFAYS